MSIGTLAGLCAIAASLLFVVVVLLVLGLRAARLAKKVKALSDHPAVGTLRQFEVQAQRLKSDTARLSSLKPRFQSIAQDAARLEASAGSLDLNIDRLAFATRFLLRLLDLRI
jgi:hypothetical protein